MLAYAVGTYMKLQKYTMLLNSHTSHCYCYYGDDVKLNILST